MIDISTIQTAPAKRQSIAGLLPILPRQKQAATARERMNFHRKKYAKYQEPIDLDLYKFYVDLAVGDLAGKVRY